MIDGLNISLPIWQDTGSSVVSFHDLVLRKPVVDGVVMSLSDKITGDVYYKDNSLEFTMKEFVVYNDVNYYLVNPPTVVREGMVKDNSDAKGMTKYSLEFYHPMYMLSNFPFSDVAVSYDEMRFKSQDKTFSWIGKPADFVAKLNKNLENTEWVVVLSDRFPQDKADELSEVLSFDNATIADALKTGYETWNVPYVVDKLHDNEYFHTDANHNNTDYYDEGKRFVVLFGLPSNEIYEHEGATIPYIFKFGQGVGLKNNSRNPRNNKIVTRIAGYGSERNIPYGYPQIRWYGDQDATCTIGDSVGAKQNVEINGKTYATAMSYPIYQGIVGGEYVKLIKHPFTRKHLMPSVYAQTVFNKVSQYLSNGSPNPNYNPDLEIIDYYDAVENDEGYEYANLINTSAPSYEIHEFEDIYPELGEEQILSATPINAQLEDVTDWDDTMDDDGNYLQSYFRIHLPQLDFDIYACAAITEEMKINMRSGACIGCTFNVQVDWEDYKMNFYDSDMNFAPNGSQRDYNRYPDSRQEGGIWVIVQKDINTFGTLMPNIYQKPASGDVFVILGISLPLEYITDGQERLDDAMKSYMFENNIYYYDYPLKFDEYFLRNHQYILNQIRPNSIIRFEYNDEPIELFVKQLTIKYGESVLPQYDITLTDNIDVVLNAIGQVADDVQHIGSLVALLRQSYSKSVWAEMLKKLSKIDDDTANGLITFLKGLRTGQFVSGWLGSGANIDSKGNSEFESVYVRGSMTAAELVFNLVSAQGGEAFYSSGQGTILSVGEDNGIYTAKLKLEGDEYATIKVGDLCRGTYNTIGTDITQDQDGVDNTVFRKRKGFFVSYFKVVSIITNKAGECEFEYILRDGTTFHPCPLMTFAQYGNTDYTTRQSLIYLSAIGETPRYLHLANVNDWEIKPENIKIASGYIEGMVVWERVTDDEAAAIQDSTQKRQVTKDGSTYWIALKTLHGDAGFYCEDNIYLGGIIDQFKAAAMDAIEAEIANAGQARVMCNYDAYPVDCNSAGEILENKTLNITASIWLGNTSLTLDTCSVTWQGQSISGSIPMGSNQWSGNIAFVAGDVLTSGVVSLNLVGHDTSNNSYTATKTISIIANKQGNNGVSAARLNIIPDSVMVDCDNAGYIKTTLQATISAELYIGNDKVTNLSEYTYSIQWIGSSGNYTPSGGYTTGTNGTISRKFTFTANTTTPLTSSYIAVSISHSNGLSITRYIPVQAIMRGADGQDGRGIVSSVTYYMITTLYEGVSVPSTDDDPLENGWLASYQEPTEELPYLWRFTRTTYTSGTTIEQTDAELVGRYSNIPMPNILDGSLFLDFDHMDAWRTYYYKSSTDTWHSSAADDRTPYKSYINNNTGGTFDFGIDGSYNGRNAYHAMFKGKQASGGEDGSITFLRQNLYSSGTVEKISPATWYTLSFWMKGTKANDSSMTSTKNHFRLDLSSGLVDSEQKVYKNGTEYNGTNAEGQRFYITNDWQRHTLTFKTPSSFSSDINFALNMYTTYNTQNIWLCMPKLEIGKIATSYVSERVVTNPMARTSTWEEGKVFYKGAVGEPYMDISTLSNKWYRCKRTHISTNENKPQEGTETTYWEPASNFNFVATDLLLADTGVIDLLFSQKILMRNSDNQLTASINADGKGSYCIYYPESGRKMFEFSSLKDIICYNDDDDSSTAWRLGVSGKIEIPENQRWGSTKLYKLTSGNNQPANDTFTGNANFVLTTYPVYYAGVNGNETYDGRIYALNHSTDFSTITTGFIAEGWYTRYPNPVLEFSVDESQRDTWMVEAIHIVNGKETETLRVTTTKAS